MCSVFLTRIRSHWLVSSYGGGWMICHFSMIWKSSGGVGDMSFHWSSSIYILRCYNIIFVIFEFSLGSDRPSGLFFRACFAFFLTHASLLTFFVSFLYLISFLLFPCALGKTLLHEYPISYSRTEWYPLLFSRNNWNPSAIKQIILN